MSQFWTDCLARFESELPAQQFNAWIKTLRMEIAQSDGDGGVAALRLRLIAPNGFILKWVRDRYLDRIETLSRQFFTEPVTIDLVLDDVAAKLATDPTVDGRLTTDKNVMAAGAEISVLQPDRQPEDLPGYEKTRLNPEFTFNTLVTGRSNDLARAAAQQVAINPGFSYNPLFIYGGVGLGKTHLVHALGNEVLRHAPNKVIRYIHAEDYFSDVVRAYQQKSFDVFKRTYRSLDVLLVDDIQFFNNKARTQEEFFYAFNALVEAKKQIVITCDTYPKDIQGLEERLISRFDWGLTVQIEPPELEMRVAILKKKADSESIDLVDDVAILIAKHLRSNVRELEGALKKVLAFSRFHGREITLDLAKEALKDIIGAHNRQITLESIQKTVADYYKIKVSDMYSQKRTRAIARPRQVAMWLARDLTPHSLPEIGDAFGGRDHTTVLHACRTIVDLRSKDNHLNNDVLVLSQTIKG
ncbi:MAG: chromosomal replication initiator protein DnaA [Gammaproteobacteria bacterium]|nr:chromosomal replication initiator protein DnaA [Rhodocyclaceae bacterium]MBU3907732.1 chromosomal replication initiator protein DnaA [Gammaproteobacteria bacterium]MBU3989836.1 chromosomal replication initiator protein DnaA [Gammaproteobacteria bacterium]MBU4004378.1 chromosomal replication initiator protein DnaA [Gammaproteobacteria bacterium]MBU4019787.1 chromosomal replication initiator protein DnaA [Gammaproteobacteria bacterium]